MNRDPSRPTEEQALAACSRLQNQRWTHPDPAGTCTLKGTATAGHPKLAAAVACEQNSQLIAWKRAKAKHQQRRDDAMRRARADYDPLPATNPPHRFDGTGNATYCARCGYTEAAGNHPGRNTTDGPR